tara:strand:- start:3309 stop:3944 length:636 start_codon:yes stop_codon:yes gene_type:complete
MKKLILLALLLTTVCVSAQYYEAKLLMTDGTIKEGFARLPSNQLLDSKVEYRTTRKGETQKFEDDEVHQILITSEEKNQFLFTRTNVVHLYKSFGKEIEKEKKNKHWMLLYYSHPKIKEFFLSQRYKINRKGKMIAVTGANSFWSTVYFLFQRPEEEKAYVVSGKGFPNGMVRKAMAIYFKDTPTFAARIESKEFKKANVSEVAKAYTEHE